MKLLHFTAGCLLGISTYAVACTTGINLKVDRVTLNNPVGATAGPTTINFRQSYASPPLVFILPGNDSADPATIRILSVSTTGFQVGTAESEGEDGVTTAQNFNYLAIEAGSYNVPAGPRIQAGTLSTTQRQSGAGDTTGYATASFSPTFGGSAPMVIHELQSFSNDPSYNFGSTALTQPWLETISLQASATGSSAPVALERAETSAGTVTSNETLAWFAMTAGTGSFTDNGGNTINYNAFSTASNIDDSCTGNAHGLASINTIAVASQTSRNGNNGGWLRLCNTDSSNVSIKIQEDRANDPETGHASESATVIAFSQAFDSSGGGSRPKWEADTATVNAQNVGGSLNFTTVSFPNAFQSTPLIFALPTTEGLAPASVRFKNISTTGFQIAQVEPQGESGAHPSMTVDYLAITPGTHTFPNGTTVFEAGSISTSAFQGKNTPGASYTTLTFSNTFAANPAILLDVQSTASEPGIDPVSISAPWLEVTVESGSITTNSARIAMERAETSTGTVVTESIAYLAAETAIDDIITSNGGAPVAVKTMTTPNNIRGFDNGCFTNNYNGGAFATTPYVIAQQISRNGADGGWIRRCSINSTQIGLTVDEDRAADTERSHTSEVAAVLAFEKAFEWCPPLLNLAKNSSVTRDLINGTSNPKAIPGALQTYALRLNNEGRIPLDDNKVVLTDKIPAGTSVFVQSSAQYPEAPLNFIDGTGATVSGLSFVYSGPASTTDDIEFSNNNGSDFLYIPTPDGDGFDSAVTDIKINPKGVFNASNGTDIPTFTMEFSVRVD
ncbi:MAG: hypothetical protein IMF14_06885 [Proteobacteria bacterium]|nr:hypothetical protein [Pseudomonadota bacterium]